MTERESPAVPARGLARAAAGPLAGSAALQAQREAWVQCDRCQKWRRVPASAIELLDAESRWCVGDPGARRPSGRPLPRGPCSAPRRDATSRRGAARRKRASMLSPRRFLATLRSRCRRRAGPPERPPSRVLVRTGLGRPATACNASAAREPSRRGRKTTGGARGAQMRRGGAAVRAACRSPSVDLAAICSIGARRAPAREPRRERRASKAGGSTRVQVGRVHARR